MPNPQKKNFDVIIIGSGTTGSVAAHACRKAGRSVMVIDERPLGGTCALRGCDPKKVLVGAADVIDWTRRMERNGIIPGDARIDWPALMLFKKTFTDPVSERVEQGFAKASILVKKGHARFVGPAAVQVGDEVFDGRNIVIATGAKPMALCMPGEEHMATSDDFLELAELPQRIIFVGGGYVSLEFAHIAARAGAGVTVLHRGARILEGFDADLVEKLTEQSRQIGLDIRLNTRVERIEKTHRGFSVQASIGGKRETFEGDLVVHGAGRVAAIGGLDLETAQVTYEKRGVVVNEFLQSTTNPAVYAGGDMALSGGLPLTPVAGYDGRVIAKNILEGNTQKADYRGIASAVFTIPPLASVGLGEDAARDAGLKFRVSAEDTSGWYASRRIGETHSAFKVLVENGTDKILGAHILGHNAEELINVFALAIRFGLRASDLKEPFFAYPTHGSNLRYMV